MYTKASDLREYYDMPQGMVVQRVLRQHIRSFWPDVRGQRVLGLGYPLPYLRPLMAEAERVTVLMPGGQGAVYWPPEDKGLVGICDESELPIETNSIDRLLIVHGFQGYESLDATLREAWRVLAGQGKLLLLVPNRTGIWARVDNSPFGRGAPYSLGQIRSFLKDYLFVPERAEHALFVPPSNSRLLLATAPAWEKLGSRFFSAFGGVNIVEARKQLYAGTLSPALQASAARRRVLAAVKQG